MICDTKLCAKLTQISVIQTIRCNVCKCFFHFTKMFVFYYRYVCIFH